MNLEEGDVVLCTVDRIIGTVVFVKIEGNGDGTIITSEVAAGRIRNLRDYVVPKKKIVCKVLRAFEDKVHLSLRRVTKKEREEVMDEYKQEKSYKAIFKTVLGKEKAKEKIKQITKEQRFYDFIKEAKENSKKLEKVVNKTEAKKILDIIKTQKPKTATIKKQINLTTTQPNGLELIKNILEKVKGAEVKYISAGKYTIKTEAGDIKSADNKLKEIFEKIEKQSKKDNLEFSIKEKKK